MGNFKNNMRNFMMGRRGTDELGRFVSFVALILIVLQIILRKSVFYYAAMLAIVYQIFRSFSRNIVKRDAENRKYLEIRNRFFGRKKKASGTYGQTSGTPGFRYFNCPGCGMKMRAPQGKGRIRVTCKSCGKKFETMV